MPRKRYVQVGLGGRGEMYTQAITRTYADSCELVGLCDRNPGRIQLYKRRLPKGYGDVPEYDAAGFDKMIRETKPDTVVVTTMDSFHDVYIVRAMELGCDVITEKPMTTTAEKCQRIVDAVKKTGKNVRVTFNYRYSPVRSQVKELLMSGVIGEVLSVEFKWLLNISHGADYYRRWHRNKENSGGLMVHKATHHFDAVNWWIGSRPAEVVAFGHRRFYTPWMAEKYGLQGHGERCHTCPVSDRCKFFFNLAASKDWTELYLEQEKYDGYIRDKCVFSEEIDIEDSMNLAVRYGNGVLMSYSLNSFLPWEGYTVNFNGNKGRLEHREVESVYISGDGSVPGEVVKDETHIRICPHFEKFYNVPIREAKGGHGGGDDPLMEDIFSANPPADPLSRAASFTDGAWSILTGVAANLSMKTGKVIRVDELVDGLAEPDLVPNKTW